MRSNNLTCGIKDEDVLCELTVGNSSSTTLPLDELSPTSASDVISVEMEIFNENITY